MSGATNKKEQRNRRHIRIRAKISGTAARPRLCVFRSNRYISVQVVDDVRGVTLASATTKGMKGGSRKNAEALGTDIAKKALAKKITTVVFDRGGFSFTGSIAAVADGARAGGLQF
jgi:large subunit ribosomal protein L18